jgi:hypothetical protein
MQKDTSMKELVARKYAQAKENFDVSTIQAMSLPLIFPEALDLFEFSGN